MGVSWILKCENIYSLLHKKRGVRDKTKKAEATQLKNWKTFINKFGKMKYNVLTSENKNNMVFKT